jgi:hypothetical protein
VLADLPELKSVGIYMLECVRFLVLDKLLEDTDFGIFRDLDGEDLMWLVAEHPAVDIEDLRRWWIHDKSCV